MQRCSPPGAALGPAETARSRAGSITARTFASPGSKETCFDSDFVSSDGAARLDSFTSLRSMPLLGADVAAAAGLADEKRSAIRFIACLQSKLSQIDYTVQLTTAKSATDLIVQQTSAARFCTVTASTVLSPRMCCLHRM